MSAALRTFVLDEVNGMIDSLDETVTQEDMGRVLFELRDAVRDGTWQATTPATDRNAWDSAVQAKRAEQRAKGYTAEHDRTHGVEHLLLWAQDYAARGRHLDAAALVEAAREVLLWQRAAKSDYDVIEEQLREAKLSTIRDASPSPEQAS